MRALFASSLLILMGLAAAPRPSIAQQRNFDSLFLDVRPSHFMKAAFEQPYGRAIVAQFASALRDSADPECLKRKGIAIEQLEHRAHAMLSNRGTYMLERLIGTIDQAKFRLNLRARLGTEGVAEFDRLRKDPKVRAYLQINEPAELAFIAGYTVENVNRYTILNRIELKKPISPIASDIPSVEQLDPTAQVDGKLNNLVANDTTGDLARYIEMHAMAKKPFADAANMKTAQKLGPAELLARPKKGT